MPDRLMRPFATALNQVDPGPGVIAGVVAIFTAFWNLHVVVLSLLVVTASGVDLLTGARRARVLKRLGLPGGFQREVLDEGAATKAVHIIAITFLGVCADTVLTLLASPADLGVSSFFRTMTPVLAFFLAVYLARELSSIVQNLEETPGARSAFFRIIGGTIEGIWRHFTGARRIVDRLDDAEPEELERYRRFLEAEREAARKEIADV